MKSSKISKLLTILCFIFYTSEVISSERARYASLHNYKSELGITSYEVDSAGHIFEGDVGYPAKFCSNNSNYTCIISPYLSFSIPIKGVGGDWIMYGWKFKELPSIKLQVLNQQLEVRVISAMDLFKKGIRKNSCDHVFLYNKIHGLVADIQSCENNKWNATYFLSNDAGFGGNIFNKSVSRTNILNSKEEALIFSNKVDMNSMEVIHNCIFIPKDCKS